MKSYVDVRRAAWGLLALLAITGNPFAAFGQNDQAEALVFLIGSQSNAGG